VFSLLLTGLSAAAELPTLAGPAMGTTYRVTLAADIPGMNSGEVHRDVEAVLTRIDRAASTWRNDSDASRFNRAAANEWVTVSADLLTLVETAREIHEQSDGAFDITVSPLVRLWSGGIREPSDAAIAEARACVGMRLLETRPPTAEDGPALRKTRGGVAIDVSGIAPGYAVDCIGERLMELGSAAHLVELGGEVRAWGQPSEGRPWRVWLRAAEAGGPRSADEQGRTDLERIQQLEEHLGELLVAEEMARSELFQLRPKMADLEAKLAAVQGQQGAPPGDEHEGNHPST
jgi:thiamine biosynthesis lipoprotein